MTLVLTDGLVVEVVVIMVIVVYLKLKSHALINQVKVKQGQKAIVK